MKNKKGDIWVSAVLYFGLGIIVISILLAAGLPVINKLKDKNVLIQTKEAFNILDENMLTVISGGPDSQRPVTLTITKGEIAINDTADTITWTFTGSTSVASEPGLIEFIPLEGTRNVQVRTTKEAQSGKYKIEYKLDYTNLANIKTAAGETKTLRGTTKKLLRNIGVDTTPGSTDTRPQIEINQI